MDYTALPGRLLQVTKLLSTVVVAVAACGGKTAGPAVPIGNLGGPPVAGLDQSIRRIDFGNRGYDGITVVDGAIDLLYDANDNQYTPAEWDARYPGRDPVARGWLEVAAPVYADVDHDQREEAMVMIATNTGGTGTFDTLEVYTLRDGAPVELGVVPGGDRADGGLGRITVDDRGEIVVERYVNLGDGACCPRASLTEVWRWTDAAIAEDVARRTGPTPL
jgi:hypothetical protein